jgi:radical SAM protein with 4Fe4S-binding SPASM domain
VERDRGGGVTGPYLRLIAAAAERSVPLDVMIELTHRCNFRCRHCYIPDLTVRDGMTTGRIMALLEELAEMGTLRLALSGGETTVRRDWLAIARRARWMGFEVRLLTNGSRITPAAADAIASMHATVEVSLYSLHEATFAAVTGVAGSLARVLAGIARLRARGVEVLVKAPVMTLNAGDVVAVARWAAEQGLECRTDPVISHRKDGALAPIALRVPPAHLLPYYAGPGAPAVARAAAAAPTGDDEPLCAAGSRYANITAAGDVLACNLLPVVAGNVNAAPFREIWERSAWLAKLRALRRRDLPVCSSCSALPACGRCPAQALVEDDDLLGPSRWACENAGALAAARASLPPST